MLAESNNQRKNITPNISNIWNNIPYILKAIDLKKDFPAKEKKIGNLIQYLQNSTTSTPNYAFFLGAGASASSGISTAIDLVDGWRKKAYTELNELADPEATCAEMSTWLAENAKSWYERKSEYSCLFEREFSVAKQRMDFIEKQVSGKMPSIGYPYLVKLAEKNYCNVVFTTNFDDLLNESFYQFSSQRPVVCAHDSSVEGISVATPRPKVIKLHGDFLYEKPKATLDETNRLSENMDRKLKEFAKIFGMIVVGYSGGDRSIMRIIEELIDNNEYLGNGLYWCFRAEDVINDDVLNLIRKKDVFYVIIEGFDELMAELYGNLCGDVLPFEARPGSDFAAQIVKSYECSDILKKSGCAIIRNHIAQLAEAKNSSAVAEALQSLHLERSSETKLKDDHFIKYVQLTKLLRVRSYQPAFDWLKEMIADCDDKEFKMILYSRLYQTAKSLYQPEEAKKAIAAWKDLEPENIYLCLPLADVTQDPQERLQILKKGADIAPFDEVVAIRYADELESAYHRITKENRPSAISVVEAFKQAIRLDPVIGNPAWRSLFDFLRVPATSVQDQKADVEWILDSHLTQDSYDHRTVELVLDWCELNSENTYKGNSVGDLIQRAYLNHYPKKYASFLRILKDVYQKHNNYGLIKELVTACESDERIARSAGYINVKMNMLYSIYRDLDEAISVGEEFISRDYSSLIERNLFRKYLAKGDLTGARRILKRLRGAIDIDEYIDLEAEMNDVSGDSQSAIDLLESRAIRIGKNEDYYAIVSYHLLKLGKFQEAKNICSEFLTPHAFSKRYPVIIINYEYAKFRLKGSPSKQRLQPLIEGCMMPDVKAVAKLLIGNTKEFPDNIKNGKKLLIEEIEKDFANLERFSRWPVLDEINFDFSTLSDSLIKSRRIFPAVIKDVNHLGETIDV